ncbi:short-chain dehydrogenase [Pseudomonas taeanensis MS-3]|uniref:Short-chain dehydrogenase n=1 Tax=Pseudomonas taeanensis MS-3 TaxID=1395571 RepID=A0A0A1YHD8_9PSED|nr:SDR family oxidoreductase [Pseudomonas taeanensis]KFX68064.1 short-chain dehydrogenase [Pseudomonas taeanensis MS-3]
MSNILISGAASGIGAATARLFHARGWQVGLLDIEPAGLAELASELGGAWHAQLDVVDAVAVQTALAAFCALHGGQLRLLFNCAGVLQCGYFEEIELAEHARIMQINVLGLLNMTHAAFPYLQATADAQVINMGSASGLYGVPHLASYSASKFAVRGLTEALDLEWARYGIRVGDLMPPFVSTPMLVNQRFEAPVMRRMGVKLKAEDIAAAVWQQAQSAAVHRPVSASFKLMYWAGQLSPAWINRLIMRWLSRD